MRRALASTAIAAALIGMAAVNAQAATSGWKIAQTNTLPKEDGIERIAVTPGGGSWAAGYQTVNKKEVPLVQHLTSKGWKTIASPSSALGHVDALTASSNENVWAFGSFNPSRAAHWNGKRWTSTAIANNFQVVGAAALSATNVWTVGGDPNKFAEHWNGRSWKKVTLPAPAEAIHAISAKDIWAVGSNKNQPAVMHWTGSAWKLLKVPAFKLPTSDAFGTLHDVVALSDKNVWAVGGVEWQCGEDGDDPCSTPITLHWNGHTWSSTVAAEAPFSYQAATPDAHGGLWLLKGDWDPTLVHEVSGKFTSVAAPRPSGHDVNITDLATVGKTVWASGVVFPVGDGGDPTGNGIYLRNG
jgi:hypothetical protein